MPEHTRTMPWMGVGETGTEPLLTREWLVTNGLGGYASGSISGIVTRRYHGALIAALPSPFGRIVMLNHLSEQVVLPGGAILHIGAEQRAESVMEFPGAGHLTGFRLEHGLPVWRYELDGVIIDKHIVMLHMQNTVHVSYELVANPHPGSVRLELRPSMHFRSHESAVSSKLHEPYVLTVTGDHYEIGSSDQGLPPLRMLMHGEHATFVSDKGTLREVFYRIEAERGYDSRGLLWSAGYFTAEISENKPATLVASTEQWSIIEALNPTETMTAERERRKRILGIAKKPAQTGFAAELVMAADQFIITPAGRVEDAARAHASGDEVRTVIAGYHWFTDWGRDTMISLEGLTLTTGRMHEAGWILRTFAHYVNEGLIPNLFPEGEKEGLYHTADATLWFFHALNRYLEETGDRETLKQVLPKLESIVQYHLRGTKFGIGVDPADGLLKQGQEGYQLTWMDAKVEGWVVTPRRGKAVEINALWYNALRLLIGWLKEERGDEAAAELEAHAQRAYESFNKRFWYEKGGYLYDVVDGEKGDDASLRPNQIFSISLPYPVLDQARWAPVMTTVEERLLTPMGLRSLAPGEADYKPKYFGDLRARDAAYHQGTVWAWLIGPFIDAWLKVNGDRRAEARKFLEQFSNHLNEACIGSISEIFDAEEPFTPRGCVAQAWSVAEVLRTWVKTTSDAQEEEGSAAAAHADSESAGRAKIIT
ncbi:MAG: amylo-alpha-1,6-glucosidase [Acidobacteriota bacterium]